MTKKSSAIAIFLSALCFYLAFALQIQATLFSSEGYEGLRLNLADPILPLAGLFILGTLLFQRAAWPKWNIRYAYIWLAALSGILALALVNTYFTYAQWSPWALTNKMAGWAVLCAYFVLGGWIASNADEKIIRRFFQIFIGFFSAVLLFQLLWMMTQDFDPFRQISSWINLSKWLRFPLEGFMANRNAYALLGLVSTCFMTSLICKNTPIFPKWFSYVFFAFLPMSLLEIGSRAYFVALPLLFIFFALIYKKQALKVFVPFLIGCALIFALYAKTPENITLIKHNNAPYLKEIKKMESSDSLSIVHEKAKNEGDSNRVKVLQSALEAIKDSPLLGAGLGSAMIQQKQKYGQTIAVIDSTPIWLWVETGILGLGVFLAFYFTCLKSLWKNGKEEGLYGALRQGCFFTLLAFSLMSLFHEMLYSRQIWFLLGLALALPLNAKKHRNQ